MDLDTIESLAILGGIGAALSPLFASFAVLGIGPIHFTILTIFYYFELRTLLLFLSLAGGFLGCVMAIKSGRYATTRPDRAAADLRYVAILVLVVGFLAPMNILQIVSGMLILIAALHVEEIWRKIQQARTKTGWPYSTVSTSIGSDWARRFSCRFCGAPLVVRSVKAQHHLVMVKTGCALDETSDKIRLPLSQMESWTPIVADRLHRCEKCGKQTVGLIIVRQDMNATHLQAYCPQGHLNKHYRFVWTPLYPQLARIPVDVGVAQSVRAYPQVTPVRQPISISTQVTSSRIMDLPVQYCRNCGVRIDYSDRFCYRCGSQIQ